MMRTLPAVPVLLAFAAAVQLAGLWRVLERPIPAASVIAAGPAHRLDLNTAQVSTLSLLPAVGDGLAQRIVERRDSKGPFTAIEQLRQIKGIGEVTLRRVQPFVYCSPPSVKPESQPGPPL